MKIATMLEAVRLRRMEADASRSVLQGRIEALRADMAALERQIAEVPEISMADGMRAVADGVAQRMPGHAVHLMGPHGIDCLLSIHVRVGHASLASLTFRPDYQGGYRMVDYSRNTGEFPSGSVGARAGANHPDVPMPETVEELAGMLEDQMARRAA